MTSADSLKQTADQSLDSQSEIESDLDVDYGSDSTDVISSSDEEERWKETSRKSEIPADYWNIQKLVKFVNAGNPTVTIGSLCRLKDYDLTKQINQLAIFDVGGLEVLVNLLDSNDIKCRLASLNILSDISMHIDIRRTIVDFSGIPLLVKILSEPAIDLKTMAAETLANVCKVRQARQSVRKHGGIPKLVDLLDVPLERLRTPKEQLHIEHLERINMAIAGAKALSTLSASKHNVEIMRKYGIVPLMARLIKSTHIDVVIPVMATCQQCAFQGNYQLAITTEGMIPDIVNHLNSDNLELKLQCSAAIFKCAVDKECRDQIYNSDGIKTLVDIVKNTTIRDNKLLLNAATGAIWKCAKSHKIVEKLEELKVIPTLVELLYDENEDVLTNVAGAISECVKFDSNKHHIRQSKGLLPLVNLLNEIHAPLLVNLTKAIKELAKCPENMEILEELDVVRLVWSLLKNKNPEVQANSAFALCPCIENASDSGELVRSLIGALELLVDLLKSKETIVLSGVCAAIATIAKDKINLAILSEHKVIYMLADLVLTTDDNLRENLSAAIAYCAPYENNRQEFGRLRSITPIVGYLVSSNVNVQRTTVLALQELSRDPDNCITMHQCGVVPFLIEAIGSTDYELQLAAVGCLKNIRQLAFNTEKFIYKHD